MNFGSCVSPTENAQETTANGRGWGQVGQKSVWAVLLISNLAVSGLVAVLIFINLAYTRLIAQKPPAALVQLSDGSSIAVEARPHDDREPEVIRKFVADSLIYLMNWSADLPATEPISKFDETASIPRDPGVEIQLANGFSQKVTTPAWQASFTLAEDFRREFLQKLAEMTPDDIFTGGKEVVLKLRNITPPQALDDQPGAWSVDVVADLLLYSQETPEGKAVPFNKRVYVHSIDVPPLPKSDTLTPLAIAIYSVRQAGLEITGMRDIQIEEFAH